MLPMKIKITLLLITMAVVPLSVLGYIAIDRQAKLVDSHVSSMNQGFATLIASRVFSFTHGSRTLLEKLLYSEQFLNVEVFNSGTSSQAFKSGLTSEVLTPRNAGAVESLLEVVVEELPGIKGAVVFNRQKQVVADVGRHLTLSKMPSLFSDAVYDKYGKSVRGLEDQPNITMPIWSASGELTGVLIAFLDMNELTRQLDVVMKRLSLIYDDLDIYVLDQDDQVIAASKPIDASVDPSLYLGLSDTDGYFEVPIRKFYSYEAPPWRIVTITKPQARNSLTQLAWFLKKIIMLSAVVAVLFGFLFASGITKTLYLLVQSASVIAKGDLSEPVVVHSQDEIGELAETFEVMRKNLRRYQASLKNRIEELQTLYDVGQAISSTLDFNELLGIILDIVIKTLKAERGSIMLLDQKAGELRIKAARGLPPEVIKNTRVKMGERVAGYVLETGRPMLIIDTDRSQSFKKLKDGRIVSGSMLSVPLVAKDKRLGVLNISKSVAYSFDDKDLELFTALANQAAIAIDNARLYLMAITDEMTGLYLRRFYYQRLREELRRAKRYKHSCTVIMLDIDHFKNFNDTYGHQSGDMVLIQVAKKLQECVRNVDIVARIGGEEFAIICPEQSSQMSLVPAERIRRTIEAEKLDLGQAVVQITVSVGVSDFPDCEGNEHELMEAADQALYYAKEHGRNKVVMYSDIPPDERVLPESESKSESDPESGSNETIDSDQSESGLENLKGSSDNDDHNSEVDEA